MSTKLPKHYEKNRAAYPAYFEALENLGEIIRKNSPLTAHTMCLISLAGAAAVQSEGSVHSHTRRAIEAGIPAEEIRHTILLLTSTIGFPATMAALSWVNDILPEMKEKRDKRRKDKPEKIKPEKKKK